MLGWPPAMFEITSPGQDSVLCWVLIFLLRPWAFAQAVDYRRNVCVQRGWTDGVGWSYSVLNCLLLWPFGNVAALMHSFHLTNTVYLPSREILWKEWQKGHIWSREDAEWMGVTGSKGRSQVWTRPAGCHPGRQGGECRTVSFSCGDATCECEPFTEGHGFRRQLFCVCLLFLWM